MISQRLIGYSCKLDTPLHKWRITWNFAYSPFVQNMQQISILIFDYASWASIICFNELILLTTRLNVLTTSWSCWQRDWTCWQRVDRADNELIVLTTSWSCWQRDWACWQWADRADNEIETNRWFLKHVFWKTKGEKKTN